MTAVHTIAEPDYPAAGHIRALRALVAAESRMVVREYANLLIPIGMPVLVLITSSTMSGSEPIPGTGFTALELLCCRLWLQWCWRTSA